MITIAVTIFFIYKKLLQMPKISHIHNSRNVLFIIWYFLIHQTAYLYVRNILIHFCQLYCESLTLRKEVKNRNRKKKKKKSCLAPNCPSSRRVVHCTLSYHLIYKCTFSILHQVKSAYYINHLFLLQPER